MWPAFLLRLLPVCCCCQAPYVLDDTVPAMLRQVDANHDGVMSFEEFAGLLQVGARWLGGHCWWQAERKFLATAHT